MSTVTDLLKSMVEKWETEDAELARQSAEMNVRLNRGETVMIHTTTGGVSLSDRRIAEMKATLRGPAERGN